MSEAPMLSVFAKQAARRFAERTCLIEGGARWTFAAFDARCDRIASALRRQLPMGARVALFMSNRAEYLMMQTAIERANLVRVPVNARSTTSDVRVLLRDCSAAAMFHDASTADRAIPAAEGMPGLWLAVVDGTDAVNGPSWPELIEAEADQSLLHHARADDLCSINYTSGSSGRPKGVMLTHRNWLTVCRNMLVDRDMRGTDVLAHIGPLTHASGSYFIPWYIRGACSVLVEGGKIDALLKTIQEERVTVFTCVPTALTRIVNHPDVDKYDLSSLRAIGYGAEPIPQNTLQKAVARFGRILTQNYGLTEAYMTVTNQPPDDHFMTDAEGRPTDELRVGCIGRAYSFVEVVMRAPDGTPVPDGESGELTIRSEHVMAGYWGMPEETAKVLKDGWLWSGDLGRKDTNGLITLVGRSKEMLISGGFNIYPQEIEAVLTAHAAIIEAAVLGVPDPDWGEAAVAFVGRVPGAKVDAAELAGYCKPLLGFRTPKRFVFIEELPKNANGKVDKKTLKENFLAKESQNV